MRLTCWSLAGIVQRERKKDTGGRAREVYQEGGLLAAPTVCAGMCQGLLLGWDTMTSGNRMGGCDLIFIEKESKYGEMKAGEN